VRAAFTAHGSSSTNNYRTKFHGANSLPSRDGHGDYPSRSYGSKRVAAFPTARCGVLILEKTVFEAEPIVEVTTSAYPGHYPERWLLGQSCSYLQRVDVVTALPTRGLEPEKGFLVPYRDYLARELDYC